MRAAAPPVSSWMSVFPAPATNPALASQSTPAATGGSSSVPVAAPAASAGPATLRAPLAPCAATSSPIGENPASWMAVYRPTAASVSALWVSAWPAYSPSLFQAKPGCPSGASCALTVSSSFLALASSKVIFPSIHACMLNACTTPFSPPSQARATSSGKPMRPVEMDLTTFSGTLSHTPRSLSKVATALRACSASGERATATRLGPLSSVKTTSREPSSRWTTL